MAAWVRSGFTGSSQHQGFSIGIAPTSADALLSVCWCAGHADDGVVVLVVGGVVVLPDVALKAGMAHDHQTRTNSRHGGGGLTYRVRLNALNEVDFEAGSRKVEWLERPLPELCGKGLSSFMVVWMMEREYIAK